MPSLPAVGALQKPLKHPLSLLALGWALYCGVAGNFGLVTRGAQQLLTELPFIAWAFWALAQPLRRGPRRFWVAASPLALAYLAHDYYQLLFGAVPDWRTASLLPELFLVLDGGSRLALVAVLAAPALLYLAHVERAALRRGRTWAWLVPLVLFCASPVLAPSVVAAAAERVLPLASWSEARNTRLFGRLFMSLVREAKLRRAAQRMQDHPPLAASSLAMDEALLAQLAPRDVHIVVMESLVEPERFKGLTLSGPAVHPELTTFVGGELDAVIVSAFAGGTSRAEFELLCGVPSLGLVGLEELSAFSGHETWCLPSILRQRGFTTIAAHPHRPSFYNRARAYPGLGFSQALFLDAFSRPGADALRTVHADDPHLFDGDLFAQMRERIAAARARGKPVLTHTLTMYGHSSYKRNVARQPAVVSVTPHHEWLERIANLTHYRTRALAEHLRALVALDPDSLIVVVSDHVPPLRGGRLVYEELGFSGRAEDPALHLREAPLIVVDRGRVTRLPTRRMYELYDVILDRLTDGAYCARKGCADGDRRSEEQLLVDYRVVLGMALEPAAADIP